MKTCIIDIQSIVNASSRETFSSAAFHRSELFWQEADTSSIGTLDEFPDYHLREYFISIPVDCSERVRICLPQGMQKIPCEHGGELFTTHVQDHSIRLLWFPTLPVWRKRDAQRRILEEKGCSCSFEQIPQSTSKLQFRGAENNFAQQKADYLECTFLIYTPLSHETLQSNRFIRECQDRHPEEQHQFEIGVSGYITRLSDFWNYVIGPAIYHPLVFLKGRCQAQETALLLYEAADYLRQQTQKDIYQVLKLKIAYSTLLTLDSEAKWIHASWTDAMETHTRFQADGVVLLLKYYQEWQEEMFLQKAHTAAAWLAQAHEQLDIGIWFVHDSLEMQGGSHYPPPVYRSGIWGKSPENSLTLNTHINTLIALETFLSFQQDEMISQLVYEGIQALHKVFDIRTTRKDIAWLTWLWDFRWHCPAHFPRKIWQFAYDVVFKVLLLPLIKQREPVFILKNGFSLRDMMYKEGYAYHLVNLYDIARFCSLKPEPWALQTLQEMIHFSIQEQFVDYYCFQTGMNHIYLPEAFYLYHTITGEIDAEFIQRLVQNFQKNSNGISPLTLKLFKLQHEKMTLNEDTQ